MTKEQQETRDKLRIEWATDMYKREMAPNEIYKDQIPLLGKVCWDSAMEVALTPKMIALMTPEQLIGSPLVKALIEELGFLIRGIKESDEILSSIGYNGFSEYDTKDCLNNVWGEPESAIKALAPFKDLEEK